MYNYWYAKQRHHFIVFFGTDDWTQWASVATSMNIAYKGAHGMLSELYWQRWMQLAELFSSSRATEFTE